MAEINHSPLKRLHQFNPREVADELAILDAEMLRKVDRKELENGAWMKKDKKHVLSPNVMAMVGMFNQLALLIPTEILAESTPQTRAKVITAFIQIASKCHSCNNYNSLKAVLAGLQCTPIFRLDRSWKEVPSKRRKRFQALTTLMSEEHNWQVYRKALEPKLSSNSPFIPFLGVLLTDLALSQEAHSLKKAGQKKVSSEKRNSALYETYTILEPITMRHKLEKLRSMSQDHDLSGVDSANSVPTHFDGSDKEEDNESITQSSPSPLKLSNPDRLPLASIKHCEAVEEWDVTEWLREIHLEEYAESFMDNGYETVELCASITGRDMTAIGITNKHHRSVLHSHARKLLENDTCAITRSESVSEKAPLPPKLEAVKSKESFSSTLSGSLECVMSAMTPGGGLRSKTYEHPKVLVKSSSLHSLNTQDFSSDNEPAVKTHRHTLSDASLTKAKGTGTSHRRANSDTPSDQVRSFSGLPPQIPLHGHSQPSHGYSPNKEAKTKAGASPLKETPSKIRMWLQEHHHKGSFLLLRKRHKETGHSASSPMLTIRPRRTSGVVERLRASQSDGVSEMTDPIDLLMSYQFQSLSYCKADSDVELRTVITKSPHNTEAQNYKLSYQLEK